jgi:hypothetical protein
LLNSCISTSETISNEGMAYSTPLYRQKKSTCIEMLNGSRLEWKA